MMKVETCSGAAAVAAVALTAVTLVETCVSRSGSSRGSDGGTG